MRGRPVSVGYCSAQNGTGVASEMYDLNQAVAHIKLTYIQLSAVVLRIDVYVCWSTSQTDFYVNTPHIIHHLKMEISITYYDLRFFRTIKFNLNNVEQFDNYSDNDRTFASKIAVGDTVCPSAWSPSSG